ncbi:DUF5829 family protein [Allokutzneria sp. A3M-2-11 16]|uniref:DUF5829 family protein n=1 Tax=Allokutzneria sp. A3M-2-11 16 TaxID=2962043 RepID=UPI0020B69A54|nr:DUF5829 family protein [Allokutzneria sp. A3M-2-11 16]MCP3803735.1 DUF5829 family protein [Allokutzneria sp. A3M-2-11 16]
MLIRRTATALAAVLTVSLTGVAGAEAPKQVSFYNHAYAVVDRETADAVEHSRYLRDFANVEVRTSSGGGLTWTGRYLYGRETYFELFGVGDLPGKDGELGSAGLAVSTENAGELAKVDARLTKPVKYRQTRDFGDGVPVPWFDTTRAADKYTAFDAWVMEYLPEYFADPRSKTEPASRPGDVGRERYLSDGYQNRLMRDVSGIHMAVTKEDLAISTPLFRAGGCALQSVPTGVVARCGATTMRLDTVPRARAGLRQIDFVLNRAVDRHEERVGRSKLVVGPGARAVWTFA